MVINRKLYKWVKYTNFEVKMVNKEYENAKKVIEDTYLGKDNKLVRKGLIYAMTPMLIGSGFMITGMAKNFSISRDIPIYGKFRDNQESLKYLRNQLSQYTNGLPEYLSPEIKKNIEDINVVDASKISTLEKSIQIAQEDSSRIVDTKEFKDLDEQLQNARSYSGFGIFPMLLGFIPTTWILAMQHIYKRRKKKELDSLKESYGIEE